MISTSPPKQDTRTRAAKPPPRYEHSPFGGTIAISGSRAGDFRFSTKYAEPESGAWLYYYGFHFYSPRLGRWLNREPAGKWGGVNVNGFCLNNLILLFDRNGLDATTVATPVIGIPSRPPSFVGVPPPGGAPSPSLPSDPSPFDHLIPPFGGASDDLNQTAWFDKNYPGWAGNVKKSYMAFVEKWIKKHCGAQTTKDGPAPRENVIPYHIGYGTDPCQNETKFGDGRQSIYERAFVSGAFSFDLEMQFSVVYSSDSGMVSYMWTATVYVDDMFWLTAIEEIKDRLRESRCQDIARLIPPLDDWFAPNRQLKRGKWTISGAGECCVKK